MEVTFERNLLGIFRLQVSTGELLTFKIISQNLKKKSYFFFLAPFTHFSYLLFSCLCVCACAHLY